MPELPTGTVTFLFTDVAGSTRLWELDHDSMRVAMERHLGLLREAVAAERGVVFRTVGDGLCAAFATAPAALAAALRAQRADPGVVREPLRARMVLHTGAVEFRDGDYVGACLNRAGRLLAIGHGGQVLVSQTTSDLARGRLPDRASLRDLGEHRLRDLLEPEHIYQLCHPDLVSEFPPLRSLDAYPHNLPLQLTSFIGREREMAEVRRLLAATRLLTLTGSGGCGKTRLALQAADALVDDFSGGVWLAELAPLGDPGLVGRAVAGALGVQEQPDRPLLATLVEVLRPKQLLLLLDNCEHLVESCAHLADTLLRGCPGLRILATSREALGVPGEVAWRVPSLPVPQVSTAVPDAAALASFASVRLFVERARLVDPSFSVPAQSGPALAQICRRLDGIPLALELAAARVKVLSVERIAARLDDQFRLLTGGSRTAVPRQQTLRATIDWSYQLLREPERRLLRHLAVFVGGWSLEAAEAVCGDAEDTDSVLDLLTQLVDKSLVQVETRDGEERYRLLETLRQYAIERLTEAAEAATARRRHRDWFLALAERAEPELIGPRQVAWLDRLEAEHDNFRIALAWCADSGEDLLGLRLVGALWRLWHVRDFEREGTDWLDRFLATPAAQAPTAARAKALQGAWELFLFGPTHDDERERRLAHECLAVCQAIGDVAGAAWAMQMLGRSGRTDDRQAELLSTQALALAREVGATWAAAQATEGLGMLAERRDDVGAARRRYEESLALFRQLGDKRAVWASAMLVGNMAAALGDYAAARARVTEALALGRELRSKARIAWALLDLASVAVLEGDHATAHPLLDESLAISRDIGSRWLTAFGELSGVWLARSQGDRDQARARAKEVLRLFWDGEEHERWLGAVCLRACGVLAIERGAVRRGACLFGAGDALAGFDRHGLRLLDDRDAYYHGVAKAKSMLGEDDYARAYAEGRALTLEEAIAYALEGSRA